MIEIKNLSFSYNDNKIIEDIKLNLYYGKVYTILGNNGIGKTTFFKCILNLLKFKGDIFLDKKNIKEYTNKQLALKISYVPQSHNATFNYKVTDVILMGRSVNLELLRIPNEKDLVKVREVMEFLNISKLANKGYMEISGGERQLVLIARSIIQNAKILILDEPTSNLDYGNQILVLNTLKDLANRGFMIIHSTHDPHQALNFSDNILILHEKKIIIKDKHTLDEDILKQIYNVKVKLIKNRINKEEIISIIPIPY